MLALTDEGERLGEGVVVDGWMSRCESTSSFGVSAGNKLMGTAGIWGVVDLQGATYVMRMIAGLGSIQRDVLKMRLSA